MPLFLGVYFCLAALGLALTYRDTDIHTVNQSINQLREREKKKNTNKNKNKYKQTISQPGGVAQRPRVLRRLGLRGEDPAATRGGLARRVTQRGLCSGQVRLAKDLPSLLHLCITQREKGRQNRLLLEDQDRGEGQQQDH